MDTWYAKQRGSMKEINDWLGILPKEEGNFTHVEETVSMEFVAAPEQYEILVRLSGPHYPRD